MTTWVKFQGAGNDFLIRDVRSPDDVVSGEEVRLLCSRHFGVGADGVIEVVLEPSRDPRMILRNADGSMAEMSGNGLRCLGHFLLDRAPDFATGAKIATDAGMREYRPLSKPPYTPEVVGETMMDSGKVKATYKTRSGVVGTIVDMGNPHLVIEGDQDDKGFFERLDIDREGRSINDEFPDGINVHWIQRGPNGVVKLVVYERGVGPTLACGTGSCAAFLVVASADSKVTELSIINPGGRLGVRRVNETLWLSGPSRKVFEVEIDPGEMIERSELPWR